MSLIIRDAARQAYVAGLCVLPVRGDGSKVPAVAAWGRYKTERPTIEEMKTFRFDLQDGLGMIAGPVSGYAECWDFDDGAIYTTFCETALAFGYGMIVDRIRAGYEDATPRGGRRWIVRYPPEVTTRDCTLARRRQPDSVIQTLIELPTWAILAPSGGMTHPTGRPYQRVAGDFTTIAAYTAMERVALLDLARSFNALPVRRALRPSSQTGPGRRGHGIRPGDLYNARMTWDQVLEPLGWSPVLEYNGVVYWRRPGKAAGCSATTNYAGRDCLFVFSSSTPLEPERAYTKFGVYTWYHHDGDFEAAALALAKAGFEEDIP